MSAKNVQKAAKSAPLVVSVANASAHHLRSILKRVPACVLQAQLPATKLTAQKVVLQRKYLITNSKPVAIALTATA